MQFYESENHFSSTLCSDKHTGSPKPKYKVEAIDFSEWLKNNVSEDDLVICDMDIECSEYKVLPHLIENETIKLIDYLIIEWHKTKCGNWYDEPSKKMERELTKYVTVLDHNKIGIGG